MANNPIRLPPRTSPRQLVTAAKRLDRGRWEAVLSCGHTLIARKAWPGKRRWCPTCYPPRAISKRI